MNEALPIEAFCPVASDTAFQKGDGLEDITTIVSLGGSTCMHRAAKTFCEVRAALGIVLRIAEVRTFDELIRRARDDLHAALLVPELHAMKRRLDQKAHYQHIDSQTFVLPNPGLHVATPIDGSSDRTYLWTLPTLVPLVEEKRDVLPNFEQIIPVNSTDNAAHYCSCIFGGAYCVTNDMGLDWFRLRSVQTLRHINMPWHLYRKRSKRDPKYRIQ